MSLAARRIVGCVLALVGCRAASTGLMAPTIETADRGSLNPAPGDSPVKRWAKVERAVWSELRPDAAPCAVQMRELARGDGVAIAVLVARWHCAEPGATRSLEELERSVHLVVDHGVDVEIVELASQYEYSLSEEQPAPDVADALWRGRGSGLALALVVQTDAAEGTQCQPATRMERTLVLCDLPDAAVRCAAVTIARHTWDGCGGQESIDASPDDPEAPCSRIAVEHDWELGEQSLQLRRVLAESVECDDPSFPPELVAAGTHTLRYADLFADPARTLSSTRLRVRREGG